MGLREELDKHTVTQAMFDENTVRLKAEFKIWCNDVGVSDSDEAYVAFLAWTIQKEIVDSKTKNK
jgi:hypothetical protein